MNSNLPTIKAVSALVKHIKGFIDDDCRAFENSELPGIQVTIGWNSETGEWDYQTGDNSYTGSAYHYPIWAVAEINRNSNSRGIARELITELNEQVWE